MRQCAQALTAIRDDVAYVVGRLLQISTVLNMVNGFVGAQGCLQGAGWGLDDAMTTLATVGTQVEELGTKLRAAARRYDDQEAAAQTTLQRITQWIETAVEFGRDALEPGIYLPYIEPAQHGMINADSSQPWHGGGRIAWRKIRLGGTSVAERGAASVTLGYLVGKGSEPLRNPHSNGINREEGALLANSLATLANPGDDVGEAAQLAGSVINLAHRFNGHGQVKTHQVAPPPKADTGPQQPNRSFATSLAVMEELAGDDDTDLGLVRIDRVTSPEGERAWQVYIPGGQGFDITDVHSLVNAPNAVEEHLTPSAIMVTNVMQQAGVKKGENVVMVGHSHGGITASKVANDPVVRSQFDIPLVVTAGSPVDRHNIRPDTQVVSIEHTEDFVPGLDGVDEGETPGLTRVERTLADSHDAQTASGSGVHHTHDYPNYVATAELADEHPLMNQAGTRVDRFIPEGQVDTFYY
ncbi:MAG TPA: hypothetical protein VK054_10810, partial [Beutenbergiaceae bacterium]|nr:hypothetical protein [Beutenbergiaceae bacterium]